MPKLENFEPEKTFQFIINMFGPQATITNNVLEFSSDKEHDPLPSFIIGDQIRLKQVLINLTKNAFKHTYNSKVIIKAEYYLSSELLLVSVHDFGKGLSDDDQAKIKNDFAR